jgi:polyphenol oxidase
VAFAHGQAWAQNGATVPQACVPPIPPGQPVSFTPATGGPVRVRKSAFELSAAEITRLKNAYAALRDLAKQKPDDPRNWFHQGQVHCWYCSGALDGLWGQEIHGGWWFLPWHRAYLFFHEQILGALIGDPTFALPYWDWDTPGRDRFRSMPMGNRAIPAIRCSIPRAVSDRTIAFRPVLSAPPR